MKILWLCRFLPHSKVRDSGGQDTYHYIKALSEQHEVSLISFVTKDEREAVNEMQGLCKQVIPVPYNRSALAARLWRAWWRVWLPRVYGRNVSVKYWSRLRDLLSCSHFDLVVVDGMMALYGNMIGHTKRILDEIDIYSVVAYQMYRHNKHFCSRLYSLCDWLRTWGFELYYAGSYDGILVRSDKDKVILEEHLPGQKIEVMSPWFEGLDMLDKIPPRRPKGNGLLFMGAMDLPANIEAATYFIRNVLPIIKTQVPDTRLYIVGRSPPPELRKLGNQVGDVIVTGEVNSLEPYYKKCAVNVVPLLTGGGIIVKTLNGMAAGRPTVATVVGNSGTGAINGRDLVVVDESPEAFAKAVVRLLTDDRMWDRLAHSGKQFIRNVYNWSHTTQKLTAFLEMIADNDRQ